jgi:tartrate dehydratase alpha subunit/fumarate hydratase class I-like protein
MCQDTGTAIVMGKKGQHVLTGGGDEAAIARGVFDTYTTLNLRYSQMAPLTCGRVNTGNNLPAQIEIAAVDGDAYKFLFMAKGGGSANKSYLFQETKALLNPEKSLMRFLDEKMRTLGTAACPPVPPGRRHRRHQRRIRAQDRQARERRSTSTPARRGLDDRATASATSSWRRRCSS